MSFDLRITFTGLCLFAPDPSPTDTTKRRMYVFLPGTGSHEAHHARLVYDTAYEVRGAAQLARRLVCEPMEGKDLVVPAPAGGTLNLTLTDEIPSVDAVLGGPGMLPRTLLDEDPGPLLASRVTLSAGAVTGYEAGAHFRYPRSAPPQRMTYEVEWTIRGFEGDALRWGLRPFDEPSTDMDPLSPLYPIGGVVRVTIYHVLATELPPHPQEVDDGDGDKAEHFSVFYALAGSASTEVPERHGDFFPLSGGCPRPASSPPAAGGGDDVGGRTLLCIPGQGTLAPAADTDTKEEEE